MMSTARSTLRNPSFAPRAPPPRTFFAPWLLVWEREGRRKKGEGEKKNEREKGRVYRALQWCTRSIILIRYHTTPPLFIIYFIERIPCWDKKRRGKEKKSWGQKALPTSKRKLQVARQSTSRFLAIAPIKKSSVNQLRYGISSHLSRVLSWKDPEWNVKWNLSNPTQVQY